ncbi:unnamed protein product [Timema podura]|uniref:TMEM205-like domain-containing protein n=1 Tax=Timema podura TaxID=61482 RepID=A0ABN7NXV0_TIMPD|nr:unnamed protein product [Timema podura]
MCARSANDLVDTVEVKKYVPKRYQRKVKQVLDRENKDNRSEMSIKPDILAVATIKHKKIVNTIYSLFECCQETKTYRVLFEMTQPAHVVTLLAVSVIGMLMYPQGQFNPKPDLIKLSPLLSLIYLSTFMMHFGSQIWMTFVSGLSLYFNVPRHTFGEVQKVLFPRYFSVNSFLSLVTLVIFLKMHPAYSWDAYVGIQVGSMVLCFLLELIIRLYLAPPLVQLTIIKNAIEAKAGLGMEIGKYNPGPLSKCPHYVKIHQTFRKVHMAIAIGNLITMACTTLHLHYLSQKMLVI